MIYFTGFLSFLVVFLLISLIYVFKLSSAETERIVSIRIAEFKEAFAKGYETRNQVTPFTEKIAEPGVEALDEQTLYELENGYDDEEPLYPEYEERID